MRTLKRSLLIILVVLLLMLLTNIASTIVPNAPPLADFVFSPEEPDTNSLVTFNASASSDPDGRIVKYEWDFDGDGAFDESIDSPVIAHFFSRGGMMSVTLRVTDDDNATAAVTKTVKVREAPISVRRIIATAIAPNKVVPGGTFIVTIKITVNKSLNGMGLDENLPEGWQAKTRENSGASFKQKEVQWLWARSLDAGETVTVIYEVAVPREAKSGLFKLEGVVSSFSPKFKIPVVGDTDIEVIK